MNRYDIIVVGAGHAGVEAAYIAAKLGNEVLLITSNVDNISHFSCNPSIGGVAKGQIVQEIDILGGIMPRAADETFLQYKILNFSRGPSVWSPRVQSDKILYKKRIKDYLYNIENLKIYQAMVDKVLVENNKAIGVEDEFGNIYYSKAVILTTGTFLKGRIFIGLKSTTGGRDNDKSSEGLSDSLKEYGVKLRRFKTGTPARIKKQSIDFSQLTPEYGDTDILFSFSYFSDIKEIRNIPCYFTYTNEKTHEILRRSFKFSPLFNGLIEGVGPRYCPSIEDKLKRFPDRDRHQIFLEPESMLLDEYYVNGFSSSLPSEVILEAMRTLPGLENVEQLKPAYGIEYDCLEPYQLKQTLELKNIENLFTAGQINGTSGYEEAASQGLVAGINANQKIKNLEPFILSRYESYIGVLIDDIVNKNILEPYRMFTSRAENRLYLRMDNVADRLFEISKKYNLLSKEEQDIIEDKLSQKIELLDMLKSKDSKNIFNINTTAEKYLKQPQNKIEDLNSEIFDKYDRRVIKSAEIEIKYEGYIKKQQKFIEKLKKYENIEFPDDFDIDKVYGLLTEAREKYKKYKPKTLSAFMKLDGVTPADVELVLLYLKRS